MIYLLYGDISGAKIKARKMLDAQLKVNKDASHYSVNEENFSVSSVTAIAASGGLFQSKLVVILDRIFSNTKIKEDALTLLPLLKESTNIFIVTEDELTKEVATKLEKASEKTEKLLLKVKAIKSKENEFPIFSLADSLGQKDKKKLWTLFIKAKALGLEAEAIHPILLWQLKAIFAASISKSAVEASLSPFVFSKGVKYAKLFSKEELEKYMWDLIEMHHESRRGKSMDVELEKWILKI